MGFVKVGRVEEVAAGEIREYEAAGKMIALANVGGKVFAISNVCLHRGGPLGQGELEGATVTCPWHGWQFDVTNGKSCMNEAVGVETYAVEIRGDEIYVDAG
ncbi:MAG: Rieske 2Fe-2S domain-containing protein [Candidatus Acidiferrales bacterium]